MDSAVFVTSKQLSRAFRQAGVQNKNIYSCRGSCHVQMAVGLFRCLLGEHVLRQKNDLVAHYPVQCPPDPHHMAATHPVETEPA